MVFEIKELLKTKLNVTDHGSLHWILGIEITRNRAARTIYLNQKQFILKILKKIRHGVL